jgi:hypothetical protein
MSSVCAPLFVAGLSTQESPRQSFSVVITCYLIAGNTLTSVSCPQHHAHCVETPYSSIIASDSLWSVVIMTAVNSMANKSTAGTRARAFQLAFSVRWWHCAAPGCTWCLIEMHACNCASVSDAVGRCAVLQFGYRITPCQITCNHLTV